MHHLDLGLFKYQITYAHEFLKLYGGQTAVDKMNQRFSEIPRFKGLKIFHNGIDKIKQMTANEFRNLMKVSVFVMDGILKDVNSVKDYKITELFVLWNEMCMKKCQQKASCLNLK